MTVCDLAPRFSVVIPAYDEGACLERTLRSLRQQDFRGTYEVIVVDNGSTDDTVAIARRYGVRLVHEPQRGVCAARQRGTDEARGEIVVSTDADTVHPVGWLRRIDAQLHDAQLHDGELRAQSTAKSRGPVVAVAGPCRYEHPLWWAAVFPPLYFRVVAHIAAVSGRVGYLTATNVAFLRDEFPGYDTSLTQGGDEVDLLRRLQARGMVVWDAGNAVLTSSRRMNQGLAYTLVVSYGYHYALSYVLNRLSATTVIGPAPAIRVADLDRVRRRRRLGRLIVVSVAALAVLARRGLVRSQTGVR